MDDPVRLAAYDPSWSSKFEEERRRLASVLKPWLVASIEHVGSTSVPGLVAKPVIDIMAPVESLESSRQAISALRSLSYVYAPYKTDVMHWLCKPGPVKRTHYLHLIPYQSRLWHERIAFRESLRDSPELSQRYADLKSRLAARHETDREAYTESKWPFIRDVLATWTFSDDGSPPHKQ